MYGAFVLRQAVLDIFTFIDLFSNTRNAYRYGREWAHYRGENTES